MKNGEAKSQNFPNIRKRGYEFYNFQKKKPGVGGGGLNSTAGGGVMSL